MYYDTLVTTANNEQPYIKLYDNGIHVCMCVCVYVCNLYFLFMSYIVQLKLYSNNIILLHHYKAFLMDSSYSIILDAYK